MVLRLNIDQKEYERPGFVDPAGPDRVHWGTQTPRRAGRPVIHRRTSPRFQRERLVDTVTGGGVGGSYQQK